MVNGYEHPDGWGDVSDDDERHIQTFKRKYKGADSTAKRYADAIREYAMWLDREVDKTLFEAEWWDFNDHLDYLEDEDYSLGVFRVRWSAISQFYQIWNQLANRGDMADIDVPANPMDSPDVDVTQYNIGDGKTKKSAALRSSDQYHYLKPKGISQLIKNVPKPKLRNELIIKLMFMTGIRRGECTEIKLGDIDKNECSIDIPGQKSRDRTVYYQDSLNILLNQWENVNRKAYTTVESSDYLIVGKTSEQLTPVRLNSMVKKSAESAGIQEVMYVDNIGRKHKKITAHTIRHSFAVQSLLNGMDIKTLQNVLGHEDLETTKKYLDIAEDKQAEIARSKGAGVSLAQFE